MKYHLYDENSCTYIHLKSRTLISMFKSLIYINKFIFK